MGKEKEAMKFYKEQKQRSLRGLGCGWKKTENYTRTWTERNCIVETRAEHPGSQVKKVH